ncbi:MAG: NAD(+)/NADH kinase [Pseudomonadota bacterium]
MRTIGLVLKSPQGRALALGEKITRFVQEMGGRVLLEESCRGPAEAWGATCSAGISDEADVLVVLGGDGTILRAASLLNSKPVPVLGINLGRVGFMADVPPSDAIPAVEAFLSGRAQLVERMMLQVTLPDGKTQRALNDAVIHWGGRARLIDLGIVVGDQREIELRADGLIVSTPLGSSAYSYAANGPLVHPEIEAVILTPVCPYAGLKRPLLVPASVETEIVLRKGEDLNLTLDGHTQFGLAVGKSIRVVRSSLPFIIVKSGPRDYFDVLEEKLGLL